MLGESRNNTFPPELEFTPDISKAVGYFLCYWPGILATAEKLSPEQVRELYSISAQAVLCYTSYIETPRRAHGDFMVLSPLVLPQISRIPQGTEVPVRNPL